jgi:hypothetical protein
MMVVGIVLALRGGWGNMTRHGNGKSRTRGALLLMGGGARHPRACGQAGRTKQLVTLHFIPIKYLPSKSSRLPFHTIEPKKMPHVKHPTGGIVPRDIPVPVAVAVPAPDVESQFRQGTYCAPEEFGDERAGMGMGIALFVLILVGLGVFISSYNVLTDDYEYGTNDGSNQQILIILVVLAAFVIASVLANGCCCAGKYKLRPHVKKWVTAILVMLSLLIFTFVMAIPVPLSRTGFVFLLAIQSVLMFLALVFSGIFIWGRSCCAPRSSG